MDYQLIAAMIITDHKKIKDIQVEFNQLFPHLKLEFYAHGHQPGGGSPVQEQLEQSKTIGEVRRVHNEGDFSVTETMKVRELEQLFQKKYGLNVQVFRKSGNIWIQTTSTDNWTLAEQNRKGGSSEEAFIEKYGA